MNDDKSATFDDGSTTKTVDGVGTYIVAADGTVNFVPENHSLVATSRDSCPPEDKNGTIFLQPTHQL